MAELFDLEKWAKDNSPYVKIESGQSFTGTLLAAAPVTDTDSEGEKIKYTFEDESGNKKYLKSQSVRLASLLGKVGFGNKVKISRFGEAKNTVYKVEEVRPF